MAAMLQLAVDLAAILDRDRFINNVAGDPRGCVDDQRLGLDRPVEQARDLRRLGGHRALDLARLALDEIGAFKVALDLAVDVRSEERRVGKEWVRKWRSRWAPYHEKKKSKTRRIRRKK